jgi:carboxyl-terminal processing protease
LSAFHFSKYEEHVLCVRRAAARKSVRIVFFGVFACLAGGAVTRLAQAGDGPYDVVRQLARVLVLVENEYVDPVDRSRLLEGAIKGMVAELDPHSSFLPPEDYRIFEADTKGEFGGIGVEVDFQNETVVVIAPIEGSPAERAGIRSGDRIVAIDGSPVRGRSMQELVRRMRGKPGTRVVVSLNRGDDDKVRHFTLTREIIQVASVASKLLDGEVAYIRIKQFQSGTHDELLSAVLALRDTSHGRLSGVLLDLRNDPGGLVDEASAVADELLADGVIYTTRHRGATVDEVRAGRGGALVHEPVVVLVNEYSASAAELVAGALQDHHRATIVGRPTFGKGSVQTIIDLPGGSGLRLTTMRYYTPNGHAIQAQGIKPDVDVGAATIADKPFDALRESDLENHLPAEGVEEERAAVHAVPKSVGDGGPSLPSWHLDSAHDVPTNPTNGKDVALSIAYQILRGVLKK